MGCNTPGFPVLHYLLKFAHIYGHWVSDVIQPSHPLAPFSSCPQSFPASGSFPMSRLFASDGQSIETSTSASVLPMNIQDWFPLELTSLSSLLSKELILQHHGLQASIVQHSTFLMVQLSHSYMTTGKTIALTIGTFVRKVIFLLFNMLSRFVIVFLPRSKNLLISWLQSTSQWDFGDQASKVCHCFHFPPIYLPRSDGTRYHDLSFSNVEF